MEEGLAGSAAASSPRRTPAAAAFSSLFSPHAKAGKSARKHNQPHKQSLTYEGNTKGIRIEWLNGRWQ